MNVHLPVHLSFPCSNIHTIRFKWNKMFHLHKWENNASFYDLPSSILATSTHSKHYTRLVDMVWQNRSCPLYAVLRWFSFSVYCHVSLLLLQSITVFYTVSTCPESTYSFSFLYICVYTNAKYFCTDTRLSITIIFYYAKNRFHV